MEDNEEEEDDDNYPIILRHGDQASKLTREASKLASKTNKEVN